MFLVLAACDGEVEELEPSSDEEMLSEAEFRGAGGFQWLPAATEAEKGGIWRGSGSHCGYDLDLCDDNDEFTWMFGTGRGDGGTACQTGLKSYCNNIAPLWEEYLWVGDAPICPQNINGWQMYCPTESQWTAIAVDRWGDGARCQVGKKVLCVKRVF